MNMTAPVPRSEINDSQAARQWAAEDFAISIGLLRECPYHGEPFKATARGLTSKAVAAGLIDPLDPMMRIFNGNTGELIAAVERVTGGYGEHCELCAASDREEFD